LPALNDVLRIWNSLRNTGYCEGITIPEEIRESWRRSELYGVNPYKERCDVILRPQELAERMERNRNLIEQATIMMEHLNEFMQETQFIFFLEDSDNYVLARLGGKDAIDWANYSNLVEGSNWSEQVMGTNTGAAAVILKRPVQFYGYENYCRIATFSCSSSAPIFDEDGQVCGVIGVAGPYHLVNRHTLGMVVAASRAIERHMALQTSYQNSEMANLHKTAIMESMSEGVLTLDRAGRITHLNRVAARNLGIDYRTCVGQKLQDLMLPGNEPFFARISSNKRLNGEPLIIKRGNTTVKLAVSCTPLNGTNGRILGTVIILQPMKQYKRLIERVSGAHASITFDNIIGQSSEFKYALMCAEMAAKSDSNVLLLGESGVGKDMFAQAIHNASSRAREPFFALNCAALPRELISSELFGYEEGAFTGARKGGNPGKFELADQGTIFLDEIGEMPLDLQGLLLRLLEEGAVVRLGGREVIPVNVRIIAASNKNLIEEVKKGNFRLDLYYRLGVIDIRIPPLRERKDDIPELVGHFIKTIGPKLGKVIKGIDDEAMDLLMDYDWPGNIRELSNVIERAINLTSKDVITADILPEELRRTETLVLPQMPLDANKGVLEARLIRDCLRRNGGNRTRAAQELGISRVTLYRKMVKYSLM